MAGRHQLPQSELHRPWPAMSHNPQPHNAAQFQGITFMNRFQKLAPALRSLASRFSGSFALAMDTDPQDWGADQRSVVVETLSRLNNDASGRALTATEQQLWDAARSAVEAHDNRVVRQFIRDANGNPVEVGRENRRGSDDPFASSSTPHAGEWRNARGEEVRVYQRGDSIAQRIGADRDQHGVSLGQVLRAMITGPRSDAERRALSEGTNSAGGYTVPVALSAVFYDLVRAKSVCTRAGAQTVVMDSEQLKLARLATDVPAGWRSENGAVATGDPTFGAVELKARSLAGLLTLSRELVADSINIEQMLAAAVAAKFAAVLDAACLVGSGTAPEPRGILNVSGITQSYMGANGAAIADHGFLLDLREDLETANATPSAYVLHPRTARAIAGLQDTTDAWLGIPDWVLGIGSLADGSAPATFMTTTSMPITETRGTATNASSVIAGDFRSLIIGMREQVNLEIVPGLGAGNGQINLVAHVRADCGVVRATDFAAMSGIIP
jgi:HK97 family phage major capsid protein